MPTAPKELEVLSVLQRSLAEAAMDAVVNAVSTPWKEFCLDIRSTPDGTTRGIKFEVIPQSGDPIAVRLTRTMEFRAHELWKFRDTGILPMWYGLKTTITSKGECTGVFNYEASCIQDPAFRGNQEF